MKLYFEVKLETGKKKNRSRTLYVQKANIADAYNVGCKVKNSRIVSVKPIDADVYMAGVSRKYSMSK